MLKDEGASGDRGSFNNLSPALPNFQTPILGYYSVTNSQSSQKPSNYVHIPPLNLKKSSDDESCENTLSNVEDLNSGASTSKREVKIQSALSLPGHSSQRSFPSAHTNRTRGGNPSETSKNIKFPAGSSSRGSNNEAQSDGTSREKQKPCKCGKIDPSCCCKSPDSADHIHCKDSATGILCPCCRSNLVSSSSSLSDCNKPDVSSELRKLEKVFKKYQKCKILQSFMKEYDDLVMKYALSKEARLAKESQGLSRGSNVPGTSHQSKSTGKTPSHFNYSGTASGLTYIHKKSNICTQDEPKICKRKEVKILAHEESQVSLQQDLIAPTVYKQKESRLRAPEKSKKISQRELNVYAQREPTNYLQQQQKESTHERDQPAVQRELTFRLPDQLLIDSQRGLNADSQRTPSPNSSQKDKQAHVTTVEKQLIDLYKESRTSRAESSQLSSKDSKSSGLLDVCLRSSLLVDATTSPFITPRQIRNNEEIACERKRSPRKKTSPPSSVNEDPCNPPGTGRTYVKSPHVSDHLIQKVRKAFSKEYEDIIKRYDDMRKEPCSKCERKWRCTADCSHNTNSPKINEVNVGNLPSSSNCDKKHDATASKTNADCEKKSKKDRRKEIICHKVCDLNEESEIYLCKENKRSKCEDKLNKDNKISEEKTGTTSNVVVCPLCKEAPITNDRNICCQCSKIQRKKFIADIIKKELSKRKPVPKPVAYNLIIEPSDCVIDEPSTRRMSLGEVIIKIPRQKKDKNKKNVQQALRASTIDGGSAEETSSTDDRIKLIFISNSDSSKDSSLTDPSSSAGVPDRNDGVPEQSLPKKYNLTLEEYLRKCRPNFIKNSEERQKELKNVHKLRQQKDVEIRKLFSLGVAGLPKLKQIQTQDLQFIAKSHGIEIPKHGRTAFNSTEMVKNTTRQYKKLPEIVCKKYEIKKKRDRKTNFLMADLFARKLKERTLKGCVNVSHSTNVISL